MSDKVAKVVRNLTSLLGSTNLRIALNMDPFGNDILYWLQGRKEPTLDQQAKIEVIEEIVEMFDDPEEARKWFMKENTFLQKKGWAISPRLAIRDGNYEDARRSARQTIAELRPRTK